MIAVNIPKSIGDRIPFATDAMQPLSHSHSQSKRLPLKVTRLNIAERKLKMGKATYMELVSRDDPMLSGGPQIISRPASTPLSPSGMAGTSLESGNSAPATQESLQARWAKMTPQQLAELFDNLM